MAKTHFKSLMNPNYLGAYSLEEGKDVILTIDYVRSEKVMGTDGKSDECLVTHFKENVLPLVTNATNARMISKLLKSPYIEDWSGHKIQIGVEKVKAFGDVVEALRVRNFLPRTVNIKCEVCGKPIQSAYGMSVDDFAKYTKERLGKSMCKDCADKAAAEANKKESANA